MCLKVYISQGKYPECPNKDIETSPDCPGSGTQPYQTSVTQSWAYSAKLTYDSDMGMHYFIAVIIEWFDR